MIIENSLWPQIVSAGVVSVCSAVVTLIVNKASKALKDVATKEFVTTSLAAHGTQLKIEIGDMFVRSSSQALVNADVEARVRRVENAFGVKLQNLVDAKER